MLKNFIIVFLFLISFSTGKNDSEPVNWGDWKACKVPSKWLQIFELHSICDAWIGNLGHLHGHRPACESNNTVPDGRNILVREIKSAILMNFNLINIATSLPEHEQLLFQTKFLWSEEPKWVLVNCDANLAHSDALVICVAIEGLELQRFDLLEHLKQNIHCSVTFDHF